MIRKLVTTIVLLCFTTVMFGCATIPEEHKGAATGAGIGAATGAVAGALLGHSGAKTEMAILGGLLGALAGGLIGHYAYDQKRTTAQTQDRYNYKTSQGTLVRVEGVSAVPASVRAGEKVDLRVTYAVLSDQQNREIDVTEIREIRHEGELVGKPQVTVSRLGGTYGSTVPITLPSNARKGKYSVVTTVQALGSSDSRETGFTVR